MYSGFKLCSPYLSYSLRVIRLWSLELRVDLYLWSNIAEPSLPVVETKIVVNTKFLKFQRRYLKGVQWLTPKRC